MGKRKERRLAAQSNAGRRVKLDLFAEPSGDLDVSDVHEEVGGDIDSRQRTSLSKSTSSSGQQAQNPLLLLEQYSDDDFEENLNRNPGHIDEGVLLTDRGDDEVTATLVNGCEDMGANDGEDLIAQKVVQEEAERDSIDFSENLEGRDDVKTNIIASEYMSKETNLVQTSVPGSSNVQVIGDVSSGWKIVMHEESNNYYYWNIDTGETSWEVPDVLAQSTQSTIDIKTSLPQDPEIVTVNKQESALTTATDRKLDVFSAESTGYKNGVPVCAIQSSEVDQSYATFSTCSSDHLTKAVSEIYVDYTVSNDELKPGSDLPSQLVNWSEILLDRLTSLQKSEGYDWTSKYILETQIRLSDFKSLLSVKTSILPFWEHSKRKLKEIEDVINKESDQTAMSSRLDVAKSADLSSILRKDNFQERLNGESEVERVENSVSTREHSQLPVDSASLTLHRGDIGQLTPSVNVENVSSLEANELLENGTGVIEHGSQAAIDDEMASKHDIHSVEDVDMEVDMDLEDASSAGNLTVTDMSAVKLFTSLEQQLQPDPPFQPNPTSGYATLLSEDVSIAPLPPDEEWIPPPPPDIEEVPPPPPPDEPAEPLYPLPPSYTLLGQTLCYTEPYQLSFPDSNIKYYGQPVPEVPGANFYGHSEATNVALTQAPFYYEAVPNLHTNSAPIIVNTIVPEGYGVLQVATSSIPVMTTAESSQLHVDSSSMRFDVPASVQIGSSDILNVSTASVATETNKGHGETTTASIQSSANGPPKDNDVVPSSNAVTDATTGASTSSVSKVQSKVLRSKKRTVAVAPSLRSNKKVSSLLDKWKAAKEELEDEEEPENAYELLERKREREIKEWHAQQIASGDAKENANFQPLGGDWRERIKRRRAKLSSDTHAEVSADGNQQPDVAEISKDLPSGWQAYWDESSKQVYYGNVVTSETSWTKPTK